ncbi:Predicted membrane protein [Amycolatopsis sacchari]|uniref:Predicted membrane protein n=2 Tax=Amycolatopsis TaxID=1813 RepID=A0A1I3X021_9PSEU|nr:Predicted membrane protein [Amycolatopsis sacchari]
MVVVVLFLGYSLPPYLGLDPARARTVPPDGVPYYYPLLVTHIFLGSLALLSGCLQLWPWLRGRSPMVHRWSGRVYVFACVPGGLAVLTFSAVTYWGPNQQAANTMLGVLWVATTIAGWRTARRRRFAEHREWMVRSFALCFSIILNRPWGMLVMAIVHPADEAAVAQAVGVGAWLSWVVNLLAAEWWLQHTRHRRTRRKVAAERVPAAVGA